MNSTSSLEQMTQVYLEDLALSPKQLDIDFLRDLQSKHIARYTFNSLAVVLNQELPLDLPTLFTKIVEKHRGGYCFEHNKLVLNILSELGFDVRLLLAKVIYNRDVDVARTHRITLLDFKGDQYVVDAGFGHFGARFPVKMELGLAQDQGDSVYRIIKNTQDDYCYQVFKDDAFFTLYTFNLNQYTEAECLPAHFYSHRFPEAAFVTNLVICRKYFNNIQSLRNGEYHQVQNGKTAITSITSAKQLYQLMTEIFELDIDVAVSEFLFSKFIENKSS